MPKIQSVAGGGAAPLIAAAVAYVTVKYVAMPHQRAYAAALDRFLPLKMRGIYDPIRDQAQTLMGLSALSGYFVMAVCICSTLDAYPKLTNSFKVQGHKNYFTASEWLQATGVALANLFIFNWFATLPVFWLQRDVLYGRAALLTMDDELHLPTAFLHFLMHVITIDVWFYSTHYVLHWPIFYKAIHKFHHRFKAPTAVACMYANPIEFCVGNVTGVVLGPALTNCHPASAAFWMAYSLISTSCSHSGYRVLGAENHDGHHEHFDYNFGVGVFMDKLFGTEFEGSAREKAILAKRANQSGKAS